MPSEKDQPSEKPEESKSEESEETEEHQKAPQREDLRSEKELDCAFLGGIFEKADKKCRISNISDEANKYIFGVKEQHPRKTHKEEGIDVKLKYLNEKGYRKEINTDIETEKQWITKNKPRLKEEFFKGNKSYLYKNKIID